MLSAISFVVVMVPLLLTRKRLAGQKILVIGKMEGQGRVQGISTKYNNAVSWAFRHNWLKSHLGPKEIRPFAQREHQNSLCRSVDVAPSYLQEICRARIAGSIVAPVLSGRPRSYLEGAGVAAAHRAMAPRQKMDVPSGCRLSPSVQGLTLCRKRKLVKCSLHARLQQFVTNSRTSCSTFKTAPPRSTQILATSPACITLAIRLPIVSPHCSRSESHREFRSDQEERKFWTIQLGLQSELRQRFDCSSPCRTLPGFWL